MAALAVAAWQPSPARADCVQTGNSILCTGASGPFDGMGVAGLSFQNAAGGTITQNAPAAAVRLGDMALAINDGAIVVNSDNAAGIDVGVMSTVRNNGSIAVTGSANTGILALDGSTIVNAGSLTMNGLTNFGVLAFGTAFSNSGTIALIGDNSFAVTLVDPLGLTDPIAGPSSFANTGSISVDGVSSTAVDFSGSVLSNDGSISASGAGAIGLAFNGQPGTLRNGGTIQAVGDNGVAVRINPLVTGLTVLNTGTLASSGLNAITLDLAAAALDNRNIITADGAGAIAVLAGGTMSSLANAGLIRAQGDGAVGVRIAAGGSVLNTGTLASSGLGAITLDLAAASLDNRNLITATGTNAIAVLGTTPGAALANSGQIVGLGDGVVAIQTVRDIQNTGAVSATGVGATAIALSGGTLVNGGSVAANGTNAVALLLGGAGATFTNNGTLSAQGSGASALLTASGATGARVVNNGTIDGVVTAATDSFVNNGTLRISTGPLATSTIANFTQTPGGTLELRANAAGGIDRLVVNGGSLAGTLRVVVQPQLFANTTLFQNAVATNGVTGSFGTVLVTSPFLRATALNAPDGISVRLDRLAFNSLAGLTRNQRAVADALEAAYSPAAIGQAAALFGGLFAGAAPQAVFQEFASAAELGTAVQNASFGLGNRFLDQLSRQTQLWRDGGGAARLAQGPILVAQAGGGALPIPAAPQTNIRVWIDAFNDDSRFARDTGDGSSRLDVRASGVSVGADFSVTPDLLLGASIGFGTSDADFDGASGRARTDSVFLGAYGSYRLGPAYIDAALGVGFNNFETRRRAATGEGTEADFDGTLVAARLEAGRRFDVGPVGVTPFAGLTILSLSQDSFTTRAGTPAGGGLFGVAVGSETTTSVRSMLGVELSASRRLADNAVGTARLRVGWAHEFEQDREVDARIVGLGGPSFTVRGAPAPRDALVLGLGADVAIGRQLTLFANLNADIGNDGNNRTGISGGLRYAF